MSTRRRNSANIQNQGTLKLSSKPQKDVRRGGTRIPCEIPITLTCLDPNDSFSEACHIILANLGGCAARSPRPVPTGTSVQLQILASNTQVEARVVNCISLGQFEKLWLLGLALNEAGNVWGIEPEPEDWRQQR